MPGPVVPNQALLNGINPLAYMGVRPTSPSLYLIETRDPSTIDKNYALGTWWLNNNSPYRLWRLANLNAGVATWIMVSASAGTLITLTSNTGGAVPPDVNGNIFVVGDGTTITGAGNAGTNTITFSLIGAQAAVDSLTGNTGGAVMADVNGNINVIGAGAITVSGNPGANTLTVTAGGGIPISFPTDAGTAIPAIGALNIFGGVAGRNLNTTGVGNTVRVNMNNTITVGDLVNVPAGSNSITMTSGDLLLNGNSGVMSAEGIAKIKFAPAATGQPTNDIYFYLNSIFIGNSAGNQTATPTVALFNIGIGASALRAITTGTRLIAIGDGVLQTCTTGQSNVAIGNINLQILTTGSDNTVVGESNAELLLTGSSNTIFGFNNAINYTGAESSNILIGSNIDGTTGESNVLRIGTATGTGASQVNKAFIAGIFGITTGGAASPVLIDANGQMGTLSSSERYKENIVPMGSYSEDIYKLNPIVFNYKKQSPELKSFGLIAEEVEQVMPDLVIHNKDGSVETVRYHDLVPMLLNEIIKLNKRVSDLEQKRP